MERFRYELVQDKIVVASIDAPTKDEALREINHYALMYAQDGPIEIKKKK